MHLRSLPSLKLWIRLLPVLLVLFVVLNFNDVHKLNRIVQTTWRSRVMDFLKLRATEPTLAWILHFNYEPHPEALKILLKYYAQHFAFIVIVCPTGRVGQLLNVDPPASSGEVVWAPPCNNSLPEAVAGRMMHCYANGLQILRASKYFQGVKYIALSNDDVVLNMTKVNEFATDGRPVSHMSSPSPTAPPLFEPPPPEGEYFKGWNYAELWPDCNEAFSNVPPEFKARFRRRHGELALCGGCDVFFLPKASVDEFIMLSNIVGECWPEMGIPNSLAMLSEPIRFFTPPSEVFMYRWNGKLIDPRSFERDLGNQSIVSFHPFKLSYPAHRVAFGQFMTKYKLN